jgi:DNA repair protein RadC
MKLERLGEFRVLTLREVPLIVTTCDTPETIADYFRKHIASDSRHNPDVESLYVICLSVRLKIIGHTLISTGTLDTLLAHPREVFRAAIIANAFAIVVLHNHPSGDPTPSEGDIKCTRDFVRAGQLLRIDLKDHLIMGSLQDGRTKDYCSLRELGYFYA